jgi:transposase-like protein
MLDIPDSPEELLAAIPTEEAARSYLISIRWPEGVRCNHCGSASVHSLSTRPEWWACRDCRGHTSLRSQSVLHRSRRPLREWLFAMWAVSHRVGATVAEGARFLRVRYATLFALFHKVRAALASRAGHELAGDVYVGFGFVHPAKRASGDPPQLSPAMVAVSASSDRIGYGVNELRLSAVGDVWVPRLAVDAVVEVHVALSTRPQVETGPPMWQGAANTAVMAVRYPFARMKVWLRRFTGVSRRYLGNYLAQFEYSVNRERSARLFDWVARRAMWEIFRPASHMALEPLIRPPRQVAA